MNARTWTVLACALLLSACTSIKVSGFVTDARTGELIDGCGVSFGTSYAACDRAGHYVVKGRKGWTQMHLVAIGYHPATVTVDATSTRYPHINVEMVPSTPQPPAKPRPAAPPR